LGKKLIKKGELVHTPEGKQEELNVNFLGQVYATYRKFEVELT
jgi:hypothetical protein